MDESICNDENNEHYEIATDDENNEEHYEIATNTDTTMDTTIRFPLIVADTPFQASYLTQRIRSINSKIDWNDDEPPLRFVTLFDEGAYMSILPTTIPLSLGSDQIIVIGDSKQLSPIMKSSENRLSNATPQSILTTMLPLSQRVMLTQSRRLPHILANATSKAFYDGELVCNENTNNIVTNNGIELLGKTFTYIKTGNHKFNHYQTQKDSSVNYNREYFWKSQSFDQSLYNRGECLLTVGIVEALVRAGIPYDQIAVITPYRAQRDLLKFAYGIPISRTNNPYKNLDAIPTDVPAIRTIDSSQGLEWDTVILSITRTLNGASDELRNLSFLESSNRWNVATTRATRRLILLGDENLLSQSEPFRKWQQQLGLLESSPTSDSIKILDCWDAHEFIELGKTQAGRGRNLYSNDEQEKKEEAKTKIELFAH